MDRSATCECSLLGYAASTEDQPTKPCLAVARNGNTGEILISVDSSSLERLPASDREYLAELLKDWKGRRGQDANFLLQQLPELSIGPLRFISSRSCSVEAVGDVLRQAKSD